MGKVAIQDIADKLIKQNGLSKKEATRFVNKMFDLIREALERDSSVKVKGLGTFKIIDVDSRESVNVNTGERVLIEGHNKITFTPDVLMKELVNKPFSQFETIVLNDGVDFKDPAKEDSDTEEGESEMGEMPLVDFTSEEMSDEDIPEWVIEPHVTQVSKKPIDLGTPAEPETPVEPAKLAEPVKPVDQEAVAEPEKPTESVKPVEPEKTVESETQEKAAVPKTQETPEIPVEPEPSEVPAEPETLVAPVEEPADESSVEDEYVEEEEPVAAGGLKWPMVFLACLISLLVGYLLGNCLPWNGQAESSDANAPQTEKVKKAVPVQKKEAKPVAKPPVTEKVEAPAKETTPSAEKTAKPAVESAAQPKPETVKQSETQRPAEAPKPPVATAPVEVKLDKYEAMDSRVRTGAYRIVGTDHVEKVKEGDNLKRIAKRTLGPDMECYIEVYNNLNASSELKKGQEIKIPKLQLKKKKTAQK